MTAIYVRLLVAAVLLNTAGLIHLAAQQRQSQRPQYAEQQILYDGPIRPHAPRFETETYPNPLRPGGVNPGSCNTCIISGYVSRGRDGTNGTDGDAGPTGAEGPKGDGQVPRRRRTRKDPSRSPVR